MSHPTNQIEQQDSGSNTSFAVPASGAAHALTQGPARVATAASLSHPGDISHVDAAALVPRAKSTTPLPGTDGLQFDSYAAASAAFDRLFRAPVKATNDDVDEVENNKRYHVKSILEALKYDGFMQAPEEWRGATGKMKNLNKAQKRDWKKWQEGAREVVRAHMKMPGFKLDVKLENTAWEIFEEIVKTHSTGSRLSEQARGSGAKKCSGRIVDSILFWSLRSAPICSQSPTPKALEAIRDR